MALSGRDDPQLQNHPSLQSLVLHDATPTNRTIGFGSYGKVEEVSIPGSLCAAKKIHDFLTKQDPHWLAKEVADGYIQSFLSECAMMSKLRHPHVVQFLGLWFKADSGMYLVMEKMMTSLHDILEPDDRKCIDTAARPSLPLGLKVSILQDVARGLSFLHKQAPPVIHRDLSARNVLLNSAMTAKIADLGMARIMPPRDKASMTKAPGALVYMPPEALDDSSSYNASIDIFSMGVLVLFVLAEQFPANLKAHSYVDEVKGLVARTELQRRENYTTKVYREFPKTHPLVWLMESCLENTPKNRPSIDRALQMLDGAMTEVQGEVGLNKLQLLTLLEEKENAAQKQHHVNLSLTEELEDYHHQTEALLADLRAKDDEIASLRDMVQSHHLELDSVQQNRDEEVEKFRAQLARITQEHCRLQQELGSVSETRLAAHQQMGPDDWGVSVLERIRRVSDCDQHHEDIELDPDESTPLNADPAWEEHVAFLAAQLAESNKRMLRYREERNTARMMLKSLQEQIERFQRSVQQLQLSPMSTNSKGFGPVNTKQTVEVTVTVEVTMKDGVTRSLLIERPRDRLNYKSKPEVIVRRKGGKYETGVLAYAGVLDGKEMAGVILDLPTGSNDGVFKDGNYYFRCNAGHGLYCLLNNIFVQATA